jgi:hypothetical protein
MEVYFPIIYVVMINFIIIVAAINVLDLFNRNIITTELQL